MFKLNNFNSLQLYLTIILYSFLYLHCSVPYLYKPLLTFKFRRKQTTNEKFYEISTSLQTLPYLYGLDYIFLMNQNLDVTPNNSNQQTVFTSRSNQEVEEDIQDIDLIEDIDTSAIDNESSTSTDNNIYEYPDPRKQDKIDNDYFVNCYFRCKQGNPNYNWKSFDWFRSVDEQAEIWKTKPEWVAFHKMKRWELEQKRRDRLNEKIKQQIQDQQQFQQKVQNIQNKKAKEQIQKLIAQAKTQGQEKKDQDGGFQFFKVFISHFKKWLGLFLKSLTSLYYLMPLHLWIFYGVLLFSLYRLICSFCKKLFGDGKKTYSYLISWKKFSLFLMLNFIINLALNLYYANYPETVFSGILTTSPIIVLLVLFSLWFLWIYAIYKLNRKNIEQKKNKQNKNNTMKKKE